jgi:hypothetical protein
MIVHFPFICASPPPPSLFLHSLDLHLALDPLIDLERKVDNLSTFCNNDCNDQVHELSLLSHGNYEWTYNLTYP